MQNQSQMKYFVLCMYTHLTFMYIHKRSIIITLKMILYKFNVNMNLDNRRYKFSYDLYSKKVFISHVATLLTT